MPLYLCIEVPLCVCVYLSIYIYVYLYIHTHTHKGTPHCNQLVMSDMFRAYNEAQTYSGYTLLNKKLLLIHREKKIIPSS